MFGLVELITSQNIEQERHSSQKKKGKADEGRKESEREKKERSTENPQSLITNTGMGNKRGVDTG